MAEHDQRRLARTSDLIVKALSDEVLVHDLTRHQTHCLNRPAAAVWRLCDGRRAPGEIVRQLRTGPGARWDDEAVHMALAELGRAHLLTEPGLRRDAAASVSRRQALGRLAAATVVVPTVTTIVVPRAAQAQSCRPPGARCDPDNPTVCCSGGCGGFVGETVCTE